MGLLNAMTDNAADSQAVAELEKKGYNPEVVDLISLKPFDMEQIAKSVKKTNKVRSISSFPL